MEKRVSGAYLQSLRARIVCGMHFCDLGPKNSRNSQNFCDSIISGNTCRIYFYDANTLEKFSGTYFCDWLLIGRWKL